MKLNKKLIIYEKRLYNYLYIKFRAKVYYSSKISSYPYLTIKDLWVSVAIRTTTENGKYHIKCYLKSCALVDNQVYQDNHAILVIQKFLYKFLSTYLQHKFFHLLLNHQSHRQTNQVSNMLSLQFYLRNLSK